MSTKHYDRVGQCRYWIFDLDGTLTRPIHDFPWIRQQLGIPANEDILAYIAAQSSDEQQQLDQQLMQIEESLSAQAVANPGAAELLQWLADQGIQMGILTRNKRHCVDITLDALGFSHHFPAAAIIGSENAAPKPDPAGINQLLRHWQAECEQTLIIGDYLYDMQAGRAAGITTVHYALAREEYWPQVTDLRVEDFQQLLRQLKALPV